MKKPKDEFVNGLDIVRMLESQGIDTLDAIEMVVKALKSGELPYIVSNEKPKLQ